MRKGLTEVVFILDRSGSMRGLEADTIGGFNSMIEKQKKEEGEAYLSTVLFDDKMEVLYDRVPIEKVEPMTDAQYYVRGSTALLDAVGGAIHHIGNVHKYARNEDVPEKTLFIITTDGMENASVHYTYEKVRKMVERQKKRYNWEFIFLGANIDAVNVARRFGVSEKRAVRFENDGIGTEMNYRVMSDIVSSVRSAPTSILASEALDSSEKLEEIRDDYEEYVACSKIPDDFILLSVDEIEAIKKAYNDLTDREQYVARIIFGINGNDVHRVSEIAKQMHTSDGRVRQIVARIKRKAKIA